MITKIKLFFEKILWSENFGPILNITIIWLANLSSILYFIDKNIDLGIIWSIIAYFNGLIYYFDNKRK